ncbi:RNA polymerase sigma factor [Dokdonella soli]|uniref:RNA polymerase sigma-70 region 2 domain-containing protein n=1 Tax=Dokdonella soli TaxID=529810 RepID=A0ABN1IWA1_9GAMM
MAKFDTTRWSLVLEARESTHDAQTALAALCRTYRPPVLAYIRRHGYVEDVAEDLTQTFFTHFIEHARHTSADPSRGRFRAFLLTALKRFLIDCNAEARRLKRGGAFRFETLADARALEIADNESPESAFERDWAITVLDAALARLRAEAASAGKLALFEQLSEFLTERPDESDYARVAAALNLRRNTLAVAVHRLRHRLRELVHEEISHTAADREQLDGELRELRAALSAVLD